MPDISPPLSVTTGRSGAHSAIATPKVGRPGSPFFPLGFRDAQSAIENYDARMTEDVADSMIAGGIGMRWPRPRTQRRVMPEGQHPGMHIARMVRRGDRPIADVALVGGWLYLRVMRALVGEFQQLGKVTPDARIVEINVPIGMMRRNLRAWLEESDGETR